MDCEQVQERISLLLDGALSEAEEAAVRAHLQECADCRRFHEALAAFSDALRGDQPAPPETLHENVMAALRREAIKRRHTRLRRVLLSAAAVLALVVALQAVLPPLHADRALGATVQRMDALEAPAETVPPEANALYRTSEAASVADAPEALGADLAALLDFLAGETLEGELPAEEPLARFVFPGGAVTLYEHDGALCYRDPVSGALCETSRSLEEIKRFLAQ